MADAWIESHQEVGRHHKTRKLARILNISLPTAVGHIHFLWWWAVDYSQDGSLARYDAWDIAAACEWEGEPATFVEALVTAGFIDRTPNEALAVHDWMEYAGKLVQRRQADAERKRAARGGTATGRPQPVPAINLDVHGMSGGRPADGVRNRNPNRNPDHEEEDTASQWAAAATLAPVAAVIETGAVETVVAVAEVVEDAPASQDLWPEETVETVAPSPVTAPKDPWVKPYAKPERRTSDTTTAIYWVRVVKEGEGHADYQNWLLNQIASEELSVKGQWPRIAALSKRWSAGLVALKMIELAAKSPAGNPLDMLTKMLQNPNNSTPGQSNGSSGSTFGQRGSTERPDPKAVGARFRGLVKTGTVDPVRAAQARG